MKTPLLIAVAAAGLLLTFAIPRLGGSCGCPRSEGSGVVEAPLPCDSVGGEPCRLLVESGPETVVDRGHLGALKDQQELYGVYCYQQEQEHRVLYVYDEVQNLVGRVVDPAAVTVLQPAQ